MDADCGSITIHFSVLDLGYGGAMVKFMAQYRAHRDARALNEIASTLFFVFAGFGVLAYLVAMVARVQPRSRLPDHAGAGARSASGSCSSSASTSR